METQDIEQTGSAPTKRDHDIIEGVEEHDHNDVIVVRDANVCKKARMDDPQDTSNITQDQMKRRRSHEDFMLCQLADEGNKESTEEEFEAVEVKKKPTSISEKCSGCKRRIASRSCVDNACIQCCKDMKCPAHLPKRQALQNQLEVNKIAADLRDRAIPQGSHREPNIKYIGETLVFWNIHEFLKNPKWCKEAMRKAKKQEELSRSYTTTKQVKSRVKRKTKFNQVMNLLFNQSLENNS